MLCKLSIGRILVDFLANLPQKESQRRAGLPHGKPELVRQSGELQLLFAEFTADGRLILVARLLTKQMPEFPGGVPGCT